MNLQAPQETVTAREENPSVFAAPDAQAEAQESGPEGLIVVGLLSIFAWAPLLYPGFIQTLSGLGATYDALSARPPFSGWMPTYATPGDGPLASWLLTALAGGWGQSPD